MEMPIITDVSTDGYSSSAFHIELHKYLLEMPLSPTSISTETVRWHFTESCKNICWKCHYHQHLYRWIQSVSISQRVANIFTRNAAIIDVNTNGQRRSSQLLTKSPTDCANSKGRVINASLTTCTCRPAAKIMEGNLKKLVRCSKFADGFLKIHRWNN